MWTPILLTVKANRRIFERSVITQPNQVIMSRKLMKLMPTIWLVNAEFSIEKRVIWYAHPLCKYLGYSKL